MYPWNKKRSTGRNHHNMKIRTARPEDAGEIHGFIGKIEGLVQHPGHFYSIMARYFGDSFFLMEEDSRIIGLVWGFISQMDTDTLFLWQIGVAGEYRGKGVSYRLLDRFISYAREKGCMRVRATVETGNFASWKMFEKAKFETVSEGETIVVHGKKALVNYYGSGTDQFLYELDLSANA